MPCFHCPRTSSHEYKWNSTSCPEGVPKKKKGTSTAKAAAAIKAMGIHARRFLGSLRKPRGDAGSRSCPDCKVAASFSPPVQTLDTCRCTCSHKPHNRARMFSVDIGGIIVHAEWSRSGGKGNPKRKERKAIKRASQENQP